jgi:hypothetical protein
MSERLEEMRKAFEEMELADGMLLPAHLAKNRNGVYQIFQVKDNWRVWQAALEYAASQTAQESRGEWKPIETAEKKPGKEVLLLIKRNDFSTPMTAYVGHWMEGGHCVGDHPPIAQGWYYWNGFNFNTVLPTHWMPLPPTKALEREQGNGIEHLREKISEHLGVDIATYSNEVEP